MYGTKDAAQCFDVASENAMTVMGYDTGKFSLCLYFFFFRQMNYKGSTHPVSQLQKDAKRNCQRQ